jgi:hypothetical protein
MKKAIGRFIFDLIVRTINYMDDSQYDLLMAKIYRPAWTRRRPLPKSDGKSMQLYEYEPPPLPAIFEVLEQQRAAAELLSGAELYRRPPNDQTCPGVVGGPFTCTCGCHRANP